jgi:hypothetical protein
LSYFDTSARFRCTLREQVIQCLLFRIRIKPRKLIRYEVFIKAFKVSSCQTTLIERNDPTPSEAVRLCTDTAGRDLLDNILCDATLHLLRSLDSLLTPDLRGDLLLLLRLTECSKCGVVGVCSKDGQKFLR